MSNFVSPAITFPILSEAVTLNITPASKYGEQFDIARFVTDIHLAKPLDKPQKFLIPKMDAFTNGKMILPNGKELSFEPIDAGAIEILKANVLKETQDFISKLNSGDVQQEAQQAKDLIDQVLGLQLLSTQEEVPAGTSFIRFNYTKPVKPAPDGFYVLDSIVPLASFTAQQGTRLQITVVMPFDPAVSSVESSWQNPQGTTGTLRNTSIDGRTILTAYWQNDPALTIKYRY